MKINEFSKMNRDRCESRQGFGHPLHSWSTSDWITATLGELGEAANVIKKLNRVRDGVPGNKETPAELREMLGSELADTYIYLDLLFQSVGLDVQENVLRKFEEKSKQLGYLVPLKLREEE